MRGARLGERDEADDGEVPTTRVTASRQVDDASDEALALLTAIRDELRELRRQLAERSRGEEGVGA